MLRSTLTAAVTAVIIFASQPLWAGQVLVACKGAQKLVFHDAETGKQLGAVETGNDAREVMVSPDGRRAYVTIFGGRDHEIVIVDVATRTLTNKVTVPKIYGPHGMAMTSDGKKLYVTFEKSRTIASLNPDNGKLIKAIPTDMMGAHYLALGKDDKFLYVANVSDDNVTIVDTATDEVVRHRRAGDYPEGLTVSPDGSELWVACQGSNDVQIIDIAETNKVVAKLPANGTPTRIAFTPDGARAVVTCSTMDQLFVFDTKTREAVGHANTGRTPYGIDISPDGSVAFITIAAENRIAVLDLETLEFVRSFDTLEIPAALVYLD